MAPWIEGFTAAAIGRERGLSILERAHGPSHSQVASALDSLGTLYRRQGRFTEAEPYLKRALAIRERAAPTDARAIARSKFNLAVILNTLRETRPAIRLYREALETLERTTSPFDPECLAARRGLVDALIFDGRKDTARRPASGR